MQQDKKLRVAYLSGPVDAAAVYDVWTVGGRHDYFGTSYLNQFYQFCSDLNAEAYVITTLPGHYFRRRIGKVTIENRPEPQGLRGLPYHLAMVRWFIHVLFALLRFRPRILVVTAFANYWFLLSPLKLRSVLIVSALHCLLWPKFRKLRLSWRVLSSLNAIFYAKCVSGILVASNDIVEQIRTLIGNHNVPIDIFLSTYPEDQFSSIRPASFDENPFRVMFAGRIVSNKGVYDLLEVARLVQQRSKRLTHFEICGEGPELETLRQRIESLNLQDLISCHGYCNREKMVEMFSAAHAVIVPSRSEFEEGFSMICVEAILAERPVITSAVCPALALVREAAIEVPPDDAEAYFQAVSNLSMDRELYDQKQLACKPLRKQFFDLDNSWGAKLRKLLMERLTTIEKA